MSEHMSPIPSMIYNASVGGHVTNSQQIIDEDYNLEQKDINKETLGVPYNATTPNGMGKIVLKKNDNFKQVVEAQTSGNTIFVIKYDFTLTGNVNIPANCVLQFDGGSVSGNYTITGNNTRIITSNDNIFNNGISIAGSWNCNKIISSWFNDITTTNKLRQCINLSNDSIYNEIEIKEGEYNIDIESNAGTGLSIPSNTKLILNGHITLSPNNFEGYIIISCVSKKNITIEGSGKITGDADTHTGSVGEWGYGIYLRGTEDVIIRGLEIEKCWGDSIYLGMDNCKKTIIENCKLHHSRRQGISLTYSEDTIIRNCEIYNISGTNPQFGIDIEPNTNMYCLRTIIENCRIYDCHEGSILLYGDATHIDTTLIQNCTLDKLMINGGQKTHVLNNKIDILYSYHLVEVADFVNRPLIDNCVIGSVPACFKLTILNSIINGTTHFTQCILRHCKVTGTIPRLVNCEIYDSIINKTDINQCLIQNTKIRNSTINYNYTYQEGDSMPYGLFSILSADMIKVEINNNSGYSNVGLLYINSPDEYIDITSNVDLFSKIIYNARYIVLKIGGECYGPTTNRPTSTSKLKIGFRYFDTTLNKPIFVKSLSGAVSWVYADGTDA